MNLSICKLTVAAIGAVALLAACAEVTPAQTEPASDDDPGKTFLAENGKREGVTTTASGLQYEVLASGDGASPKPTDTVSAHYHGTLIDGTVFDSSVERAEPFTTTVNGVIKGWQEALQLMRVGDKWKVFVPPELAYGARGAGALIGPHETLIFEMELLAIKAEEGDAAPMQEEAQAGEATEAPAAETTEEGT